MDGSVDDGADDDMDPNQQIEMEIRGARGNSSNSAQALELNGKTNGNGLKDEDEDVEMS